MRVTRSINIAAKASRKVLVKILVKVLVKILVKVLVKVLVKILVKIVSRFSNLFVRNVQIERVKVLRIFKKKDLLVDKFNDSKYDSYLHHV
jgi:hypothetical protein